MESQQVAKSALTLKGRLAAFLFAVHVLVMFFPPIPPDVKGSLWDYLLAYLAVVFASVEVARWAPTLACKWAGMTRPRRFLLGLGGALLVLAVGLAVRAAAPELFARWSREEGLWEPVGLFVYIGAAVLLFRIRRGASDTDEAKHLTLLGWGYALLAAEELDYLGIFGGMIPRIEGIYVGSLHDLVRLWAEGLVPMAVNLALATAALVVLAALAWTRYLQPRRLVAMVLSSRALWLAAFVAFTGLAAVEEAHIFGLVMEPPTPEELIELAGTLCLGAFALDVAASTGTPAPTAREASGSGSGAREERAAADDPAP